MEAFQLLARGGVQFDRKRFQTDVERFNKPTTSRTSSKADEAIPNALDFFKYAQSGQAKRKSDSLGNPESKKRKLDNEDGEPEHESNEENQQEAEESRPQQQKHRVAIKGKDAPQAADTFAEMAERFSIPSQLLSNLAKYDYHHPTAIQSHCVPILMELRDLAAISPTGTGKTLSYLLPIIMSLKKPISHASEDDNSMGAGARAVILAPTKELAQQIHNECLKLCQGRKWRVVLFSKATANTLSDKKSRDRVDIIISTPLRLASFVTSKSIELDNVRHLVLDEADRMLDAEFLDQVQETITACTHPQLQKAVFSATLPAGAEKIALDMMRNPVRIVVGLKDTPLPLIAQSLTYVADEPSKLPSLLTHLAQPYNPPVLIFTSTQPRASSLAEELVLNSIPNVDCLHAGMTNKEREDALRRMRQGQSWIMISTEVMARGLDFKGVREVINYDFPTSVQSYIHRIGRTGRAGREGKATTFFTNEDAPYLKAIANVLLQSGSPVPEWISKLPKPSKMKRKQMGKVARGDSVNWARNVGKRDAVKRRDMVAGSKRRIKKATNNTSPEPELGES
ncbi:P-loop containing nucleoside triphosphate hydrolase protein [Cylindrobasidium torrendii FP15055 ss-10]|uniref:RNA helicase n=1 Tax=Cylindrobasidium torrendii FP15055 ss-10 TaxID=1314674 RepID=A0A0D7BAD9_9AGAR|nr:P-loop containing nucleoside triphosphate hydrolase protein [Cylindrobasidium torrendii FP15055 ss-10]